MHEQKKSRSREVTTTENERKEVRTANEMSLELKETGNRIIGITSSGRNSHQEETREKEK